MRFAVVFLAGLALAAAANPEWKIWSTTIDVTTDLGVAAADANTVYTAGDANGSGPEILKSTDGGVTWTPLGVSFGPDILLLAAAASGQSCLVSSIFGELYTNDAGKTWHQSVGGGFSQDARAIDSAGRTFGVVGQFDFGKFHGAAVSTDGGKSFKAFNAGLFTDARYGAFPTATTWYVAAGDFPQAPAPPPPSPPVGDMQQEAKAPRRRPRRTVFMNEFGRITLERSTPAPSNDNGYMAQITKTTDGGKTWKTVFAQNNTFYFNGIDCTPNNPNHCCAVGEADSDSTEPGARIHCTTDGGNTWNRTFFQTPQGKESYSLMEIRFVSETVGFAVGGDLHPVAPYAWFLKTTDGGQTWVQDTHEFFGYYALGLDMVDATVGYAAVDNLITQASAIAKYTTDTPPTPPTPAPPSPAPPGTTHYGDPNAGPCLSDEEAIQVTGLSGSFCSPGCSRTTACPTDVPAGSTAQPQCVLETQGSSTPSRCALICNPALDGELSGCPTKASCKPISNTGLCTYDS